MRRERGEDAGEGPEGPRLAVREDACVCGDVCFEELRLLAHPAPRAPRPRERLVNSKGERLAFDAAALLCASAAGCDELQFEQVRYTSSARCVFRADCVFPLPSVEICASGGNGDNDDSSAMEIDAPESPREQSHHTSSSHSTPEPTVHLRTALSEVQSIFNAPLATPTRSSPAARRSPAVAAAVGLPAVGIPRVPVFEDPPDGVSASGTSSAAVPGGNNAVSAPTVVDPYGHTARVLAAELVQQEAGRGSGEGGLFVHTAASGHTAPLALLSLLLDPRVPFGGCNNKNNSSGEEPLNGSVVARLAGDASYDLSVGAAAVPWGDASSVEVPCFQAAADTAVIAQSTMTISAPAHWREYHISRAIAQRLEGRRICGDDDECTKSENNQDENRHVGDENRQSASETATRGGGATETLDAAAAALVRRRKFVRWGRAHFFAGADVSVLLTAAPAPRTESLRVLQRALAAARTRVEEPLALYLAVELLSLVRTLHRIGIVHGRVATPAFCLARASSATDDAALAHCTDAGWPVGGLVCVDLSRAVDTTLYPPGTRFSSCSSSCNSSRGQACGGDGYDDDFDDEDEMRDFYRVEATLQSGDGNSNNGWGFERDVWGVACVVHRLLHGTGVRAEAVRTAEGAWAFGAPLKRYWRTALWASFFGTLLNARPATRADAVRVLGAARAPLVQLFAQDARLRREVRAQLGRALYVLDDFNAAQRHD